MKPALYVLGSVIVAFSVVDLGALLSWVATELFGEWGLAIQVLTLSTLAGGYIGWLIYRMHTLPRHGGQFD